MYQLLLVIYVIIALLLIGLVLIQQGKGAGMGASFGSGASSTVFGSSGSGNFLTRLTAILATLFFGISLTLSSMTSNHQTKGSEWGDLSVVEPVQESVQPEEQQQMTRNRCPCICNLRIQTYQTKLS